MKIFVSILFSICTLVCHSQTKAELNLDPGNWVFNSNYNTEWSRLALNGKDIVVDSSTFIIVCDANKKMIYFLEAQTKMRDTLVSIKYGLIETWWDDPQQMKRGVYYYRTYEMGTIEYWPGEMVVRDWPGQFRKEYLKRIIQRPKPRLKLKSTIRSSNNPMPTKHK